MTANCLHGVNRCIYRLDVFWIISRNLTWLDPKLTLFLFPYRFHTLAVSWSVTLSIFPSLPPSSLHPPSLPPLPPSPPSLLSLSLSLSVSTSHFLPPPPKKSFVPHPHSFTHSSAPPLSYSISLFPHSIFTYRILVRRKLTLSCKCLVFHLCWLGYMYTVYGISKVNIINFHLSHL